LLGLVVLGFFRQEDLLFHVFDLCFLPLPRLHEVFDERNGAVLLRPSREGGGDYHLFAMNYGGGRRRGGGREVGGRALSDRDHRARREKYRLHGGGGKTGGGALSGSNHRFRKGGYRRRGCLGGWRWRRGKGGSQHVVGK
jgi:hypothetical protein